MHEVLGGAMQYAKSLGADYADIRYKDIDIEQIMVEDGKVTKVDRTGSRGYGIRVFLQPHIFGHYDPAGQRFEEVAAVGLN